MTQYAPIRKLLAGIVAAALMWIVHRLGLDLGSAEINDAADAIVTLLAVYAVPDPRVLGSSGGPPAGR
jgi:hypothetical protein